MDEPSVAAIAGCVLGVVTTVSTVINNYMTYRLKVQAIANHDLSASNAVALQVVSERVDGHLSKMTDIVAVSVKADQVRALNGDH
jgi:hypothetical protein